MEFYHKPVLLDEVLLGLNILPQGIYVDATLGGGGHSNEILKQLSGGRLIGFDQDSEAISYSQERLKSFSNVSYVHANFSSLKEELKLNGVEKVDGILMDLGVSSHQIDTADRGFSFLRDAKLDMRMNKDDSFTASDVVNTYKEEELTQILFNYGEEKFARSIARNIVKQRQIKPIETTFELKDIIERSMPKKEVYSSNGASKKTFQAIRIEVNGELKILENAVRDACSILKVGGRICVITFHSLEDRIVKNVFRELSTQCLCPPKTPICICGHRASLKVINKHPIVATENEQKENSRSTCAKLRIAEKIE